VLGVDHAPLAALPSELRLFRFRGVRGEVAPPSDVALPSDLVDPDRVLAGPRPKPPVAHSHGFLSGFAVFIQGEFCVPPDGDRRAFVGPQ